MQRGKEVLRLETFDDVGLEEEKHRVRDATARIEPEGTDWRWPSSRVVNVSANWQKM